jgi:nucleotide-binding universal stress UspA family protein
MENRILLPTDFSDNALNAIEYALTMYQHLPCDFFFLNTFQVDGFTLDSIMVPEPGEKAYEAAKKTSEREFTRLMDLLAKDYNNELHTYHTISTYNFLIEAIGDIVDKRDIDLVIMGTKGATDSELLIFGSNTVATMEAIRACPILSVPQGFKYSPPKEIVFPTDYKNSFKRRELNRLLDIAKMSAASIRVLHINEEVGLSKQQKENKDCLEAILEGVEYSFHEIGEVKVNLGIALFVEGRGSDMVAFLNRRHSLFSLMLSKPLVQELGYRAKVPILVLHDLNI